MASGLTQGNTYTGGISFTSPYRNAEGAINGGFNFDLPLATVATFQNQALSFTANNANLNRQFVGGVIAQAQQNVNIASERGFNFNDAVLKQTIDLQQRIHTNRMDMLGELRNALESRYGCFITTAICETMGLDDDNHILNTFRHFRDTELNNPDDAEMVKQYYEEAPKMVETLNKREDRKEILSWLQNEFLLPCYLLIQNHNHTAAKAVYACMFYALQECLSEGNNG